MNLLLFVFVDRTNPNCVHFTVHLAAPWTLPLKAAEPFLNPPPPQLRSWLKLDCVWNVMAHVQKPYFVFRRNGRVHFKSAGASVQSNTCSRDVRISGSNAGYTMFRGSVKSTGYTLHSPVSPSLPLPCVTVCHHVSTGLYLLINSALWGNLLENLYIARLCI